MHGDRITGFHWKLIRLRRNLPGTRRDEKAKEKAKGEGATDQSPNAPISRTPQTIALM
jgi:hypothetical protein